jgi:hypothetical protein
MTQIWPLVSFLLWDGGGEPQDGKPRGWTRRGRVASLKGFEGGAR